MQNFEAGKTYEFGFIGDADLKSYVKITKVTAKTVTGLVRGESKEKRFKVHEYNGEKFIYPLGKYSMCPRCKATAEVKEKVKVLSPCEAESEEAAEFVAGVVLEVLTGGTQEEEKEEEQPKKEFSEEVKKLIGYYETELIDYYEGDYWGTAEEQKMRMKEISKCRSFFGFNSVDEKELIKRVREDVKQRGFLK